MSYVIATERCTTDDLETAVLFAMDKLEGAYSAVLCGPSRLIGFRDKNGFRPLCIGKLNNSYIITSESCVIDSLGGEFLRDVEPGEMVVIDETGFHSYKSRIKAYNTSMCIFEYVYFARTDSVIDKQCVYQARINMGRELAKETKEIHPDIVISVPDSGTAAAVGYSLESGVPFMEGLTKNRYVGRTFIQPTQKQRLNAVRLKLNPVKSVVAGKSVVMVDDSIVRGTTSGKIVKLLKDAGAKEVHVCISSPPVTDPCYYGIDTSVRKELIASTHTEDEICQYIGADSLHYISLEGLKRSLSSMDPEGMCYACFNAGYPDNAEETIRQGSKYIFENK